MDQKISIKIAGRLFNLTASSPEAEELYRLAAETINNRFAAFTRSHPGRTANDLLSLVALNETVVRLKLQKELERSATEEKELAADLERYLKDLEK